MEPRDRMKESKMALNGRLLLLLIGIMLVFNGITTSGRNGLGWMSLAKSVDELENEPETEAAESGAEAGKTEEAVESSAESEIAEGQGETTAGETGAAPELDLHVLARQMDASGITTGDLRMLGILSLIAMVFEVCVGLLCAVFSNRVDKSKITWIAVIVLLAVEIIFVAVFFLKGALTLSTLLNSLFLPLVLLWSVTRLRKLAEADPERVFAVQPAQRGAGRGRKDDNAGNRNESRQKTNTSIRDKAMWKTEEETTEETQEE